MHRKVRFTLAVWGALAALSACGGDGAPTAEEILAKASEATLAINTVQFAIEREGPPPVIDASTGAKFVSATGFYEAPDTVQATLRAETNFGVQDLEMVFSPEGNTMTVPGLGAIDLPSDFPFNPVSVFQAEGLPAILTEAIAEPTLEGEETLEGVAVYHVSGVASGESLSALIAGAVDVGDMTLDLYVDKETFQLVRIALTEEAGDRWLIDLFAYDEPAGG